VEVALDDSMRVELLFGSTPLAYEHVTRLRGVVLSTNGDTIQLQVAELFFLQGPPLRVTSRAGAPLAILVLDRHRRAARSRQSRGNIGQSLLELLIVLRIAAALALTSS
jgi:hypothetical protein